MRQGRHDLARRFNEIDTVIIVFFDTGRHCKDVRVKDDVFRRETDLLGQDLVGPGTDFDLARLGIGLPGFIESHDDNRRTISTNELSVMDKGFLAFLHRDGIDHRLALNAFQASLDHFPFGAVNHDRHASDIRLGSNQIEELDHCLFGNRSGLHPC